MNHKYPKFKLLVFSVFAASLLFNLLSRFELSSYFANAGYWGIFLAGLMYSYSFSSPLGVGILIFIAQSDSSLNWYLAALLAGAGSAISDLVILRFIKDNLADEIVNFLHEKYVLVLRSKIHTKVKEILNPVIGFLLIASPLPDEVGLTFLSGLKDLNKYLFFTICMLLNSLGVYWILILGRN